MRVSHFLRRVPRIPHQIYWEVRSWIFPIPMQKIFETCSSVRSPEGIMS
jgi:hypothetical protein